MELPAQGTISSVASYISNGTQKDLGHLATAPSFLKVSSLPQLPTLPAQGAINTAPQSINFSRYNIATQIKVSGDLASSPTNHLGVSVASTVPPVQGYLVAMISEKRYVDFTLLRP